MELFTKDRALIYFDSHYDEFIDTLPIDLALEIPEIRQRLEDGRTVLCADLVHDAFFIVGRKTFPGVGLALHIDLAVSMGDGRAHLLIRYAQTLHAMCSMFYTTRVTFYTHNEQLAALVEQMPCVRKCNDGLYVINETDLNHGRWRRRTRET